MTDPQCYIPTSVPDEPVSWKRRGRATELDRGLQIDEDEYIVARSDARTVHWHYTKQFDRDTYR
jgi:hypothetical protein